MSGRTDGSGVRDIGGALRELAPFGSGRIMGFDAAITYGTADIGDKLP